MAIKKKDIDFTKWTTQQQLAAELNTSVQRIHNWIKRNKIESMKVDELGGITLVNRDSITVSSK